MAIDLALADELLTALHVDMPPAGRRALRLRLELAILRRRALRLVRVGPGMYDTAGGAWECRAPEVADALAALALSPGRWVDLPPGRSRRAWSAALDRARQSLARVDHRLAALLMAAPWEQAPGLRLRQRGDQVQARRRAAPNSETVRAA